MHPLKEPSLSVALLTTIQVAAEDTTVAILNVPSETLNAAVMGLHRPHLHSAQKGASASVPTGTCPILPLWFKEILLCGSKRFY
jgi:hypothetical protein